MPYSYTLIPRRRVVCRVNCAIAAANNCFKADFNSKEMNRVNFPYFFLNLPTPPPHIAWLADWLMLLFADDDTERCEEIQFIACCVHPAAAADPRGREVVV